jgi:hypothetical protein
VHGGACDWRNAAFESRHAVKELCGAPFGMSKSTQLERG